MNGIKMYDFQNVKKKNLEMIIYKAATKTTAGKT